MKKQKLKDKVVFITGASSGLGEQVAYLSAKQGATVIIAARRLERLYEVKRCCDRYSNGDTVVLKLDVANQEQVCQVIETIYKRYGKIDILVNNAGFGFFEEALNFDMKLVEKMFHVNVLGLIHITQLVAKKMRDSKRGHIINIASQGGKIATVKSSIYSATKFAVIGFSNSLRLELKPYNIQVTTVNPGPIRTDFFDIADKSGDYLKSVKGLVLEPEFVANKIVASMGTRKREINLPKVMELASCLYSIFPKLGDFLAYTIFNRK